MKNNPKVNLKAVDSCLARVMPIHIATVKVGFTLRVVKQGGLGCNQEGLVGPRPSQEHRAKNRGGKVSGKERY